MFSRLRDVERVHRDGFLLRVADVFAAEVFTQSLVGVTRIDHHHVRSLLVQLPHHAVHVEYI